MVAVDYYPLRSCEMCGRDTRNKCRICATCFSGLDAGPYPEMAAEVVIEARPPMLEDDYSEESDAETEMLGMADAGAPVMPWLGR